MLDVKHQLGSCCSLFELSPGNIATLVEKSCCVPVRLAMRAFDSQVRHRSDCAEIPTVVAKLNGAVFS